MQQVDNLHNESPEAKHNFVEYCKEQHVIKQLQRVHNLDEPSPEEEGGEEEEEQQEEDDELSQNVLDARQPIFQEKEQINYFQRFIDSIPKQNEKNSAGGDEDEVIEIEQTKVSFNTHLRGIFGTYNTNQQPKKKPVAPKVTKTIIDNSPQQKRTSPRKSSKQIAKKSTGKKSK